MEHVSADICTREKRVIKIFLDYANNTQHEISCCVSASHRWPFGDPEIACCIWENISSVDKFGQLMSNHEGLLSAISCWKDTHPTPFSTVEPFFVYHSSDDESRPESSSTGSEEIELEEVDNASNYSEENNNNEVSWPEAKWQCFVSGKGLMDNQMFPLPAGGDIYFVLKPIISCDEIGWDRRWNPVSRNTFIMSQFGQNWSLAILAYQYSTLFTFENHIGLISH